jgi:hypothetical protein
VFSSDIDRCDEEAPSDVPAPTREAAHAESARSDTGRTPSRREVTPGERRVGAK